MVHVEGTSGQLLEAYSLIEGDILNEMEMNVHGHLSDEAEHSIYYNKLRALLHPEIINYCKEQLELKQDLNMLRMMIGKSLSEHEIREYLDSLKAKYDQPGSKVGIDYHIEITRIDYGVAVFCCIIRGNDVNMKKFVFRFRKNVTAGIYDMTNAQIPLDALKGDSKES